MKNQTKTTSYTHYSIEQLQHLFVHRLDDDFFANVGAASMGVAKQRQADKNYKVWTGYEILTNSKHLI